MSIYAPPSTYRILEDHDGIHPRIVAVRGSVRFECWTAPMHPTTYRDGQWRRCEPNGDLSGRVSEQTARELNKALRAHRAKR